MRLILPALLLASFAGAQSPTPPSLIPLPAEMILTGGSCSLECPWSFQPDQTISDELVSLLGQEVQSFHPTTGIKCEAPLPINLHLITPDTMLHPEWYSLNVNMDGIRIAAVSEEGLFRGSRTLIQLLEQGKESASIPCLKITDWPRFEWRGMHLDPCRHFWSVEFTKKYIDLLARYKLNSFHWHLTDDQGWRIEIKTYPKLTEIGGWRKGSQVGPYSRREYDSNPYGGFYTQEQIREVVAYAAARHINVVPEIEMPGHALAALAAYPELGCTGGPYEVNKGWGVFEEVFCAGNDRTFAVLEDVLTEVMELFPSEIIHIGGDECPKESWKKCPKCQSRMKAEGLKDEHALQSYFIQRTEKFVNSKGRKIIGWDEILEGGLAPNAAVMSWRGTEGGVAAAKQKHNVVMSPGSHCYFDHYQGDPANEPLAIGGYTTVQKVYSYEPVPKELTAVEGKYILGAQGNVWTEYILSPEHVEYMALPRMLALAEVLWSPKEKRNEADFIRRLEPELETLRGMKVNASRSLYQVDIKPEQGATPGTIRITLNSAMSGPIQRSCQCIFIPPPPGTYPPGTGTHESGDERCDREEIARGAECTARHVTYEKPFLIDRDTRVRALLGEYKSWGPGLGGRAKKTERTFHFNKATAQKITLSEQPNERYNEGGAFTLVDGITAQEKRVNTEWLGWRKGVTIIMDLGSEQDINHIGIGALNETYGWIHLPTQVDFSVSSDGQTYMAYGTAKSDPVVGRNSFSIDKGAKGRYIRIAVKHRGTIPAGYPGAGNPAWLFLDEVDVR